MNQLPKDPVMLLSYINTELRDNYDSFSELCASKDVDPYTIICSLETIDYHYDEKLNRFL